MDLPYHSERVAAGSFQSTPRGDLEIHGAPPRAHQDYGAINGCCPADYLTVLGGLARRVLGCYAIFIWMLAPALAREFSDNDQPPSRDVPSFAELEAAGAVIGDIRIDTQDIFDLHDPKENNGLFRLANKLHIKTRPSVIRRLLLFKTGEPVSVRLIEESERLMHANRHIYDVSIVPVAYQDGIADIEVKTRDTWTLDPGISFSRAGGSNSTGLSLKEYNLLGTGTAVGVSRKSNVDRTGTEFSVSHLHAFDGWTSINYSYADLDDGKRQAVGLTHPFYALDTRWAAGVSASQNDRIDSIYTNGEISAQYRHQQDIAEVYGGWSAGLVDRWVQRYSIGLSYQEDAYAPEPLRIPAAQLPPDQTLIGPFIRYELVENAFEKKRNRNQIGRSEYFQLGLTAGVQLTRADTGLGSSRNLWLYSANLSDAFEWSAGQTLLLSGTFSGQVDDGRPERQMLSASTSYYRRQGRRGLFFATATGSRMWDPYPGDQLLLGGDNGLRGYPLRYQSGDRLVLISLEERVYTDWYPFRLFRVGGAVFYDGGRAWGGAYQSTINPGWLNDIGFGLRFFSVRSAFGNVWHLDFAFPLDADPSIRSFQFLVKTKARF
ncbi:MAG: hypothetical protein H7X76_03395 [Prolixibacteraceae bacterium]|nr:hypothetical protein [Burkholderiales bacterium]